MPLVSILICTNRVDNFFFKAIESLNKQTYQNIEIILVCNSLSDENKLIVNQLAVKNTKLKVFFTDIKFLTFSLNLGLHHSQGDYVARMDADDIAYPERIERQVKFLIEHQDIAVCGSCYDLIDNDDQVIDIYNVPLTHESIVSKLYKNSPFCHPTVVFRKDVVIDIGGYMGGLYAEDYDLWCRLQLHTDVRFANLPEKLLGYRSTPIGVARRSKYAYAAMAAAQLRSFILTGNPFWLISTITSMIKRLIFAIR